MMERRIKELHNRRSIRLKGYDYSREGAYYVTLCAYGRSCIFGTVIDKNIRLNRFGQIVRDEWLRTPQIRPEVELDDFVVMPNHFHGIILLAPTVGAHSHTPRQDNSSQKSLLASPSRTLGAIIRGFKSTTTVQINRLRNSPRSPLWQGNYYEHIVRDIDDLNRIREYIRNNPLRWSYDQENPTNMIIINPRVSREKHELP